MKFSLFAFFIFSNFSLITATHAEDIKEILIDNSAEAAVYLDSASIERKGDEVFCWITKKFATAKKVKFIEEEIKYKKLFFMMNLELDRYSILAVEYFDAYNEKVLEYSYPRKSNISEYQYNFPIYENSLEAKIMKAIEKLDGN